MWVRQDDTRANKQAGTQARARVVEVCKKSGPLVSRHRNIFKSSTVCAELQLRGSSVLHPRGRVRFVCDIAYHGGKLRHGEKG